MKQFEWSRIAIITQSDNLFTFVSGLIVFHNLIKLLYIAVPQLSALLRLHFSSTNIKVLSEYTLNTGKDAPGIIRELKASTN